MSPTPDELFPTHGAIPENRQIGRTLFIEELLRRGRDADDVLLIEPRRVGKTSVVLAALVRARAEHRAIVARIDLRELPPKDSVELAAVLLKSARETGAGVSTDVAAVKNKLSGFSRVFKRAKRSAEPAGDEAAGVASALNEILSLVPHSSLREVLQALEGSTAELSRPCIVFFDEAQDLSRLTDSNECQEVIAAAMRRSGRRIAYMFAGSEQHAMENLFAPGRPLFREGERLRLPSIAREDWRAGLKTRFAEDRRVIGNTEIEVVLTASGGNPLRTMQVCKNALRISRGLSSSEITRAILDEAIAAAREQPAWDEAES